VSEFNSRKIFWYWILQQQRMSEVQWRRETQFQTKAMGKYKCKVTRKIQITAGVVEVWPTFAIVKVVYLTVDFNIPFYGLRYTKFNVLHSLILVFCSYQTIGIGRKFSDILDLSIQNPCGECESAMTVGGSE